LASSVDLEKSLQVTHPAFEVVEKDVVEEYGAYCTLYRHKKSGAELLSVASDDDNKVRTPTDNTIVITTCIWFSQPARRHESSELKQGDTYAYDRSNVIT
jgi:hypothetical protein